MTITKIEWADQVWNPIVGCSIASHGCNNCYAQAMAYRLEQIELAHYAKHGEPGALAHYAGLTHKAPRKGARPVWTGKVATAPDSTWLAPLRRKKPTRYFVNSMGDLFHPDVPDEWLDRAFGIMAQAHQHIFIVLTKRADIMRDYLSAHRWHLWSAVARELREANPKLRTPSIMGGWCTPVPNVWLGVTAEDQEQADARIPDLLATPAAKRIVSVEPMLGPVDLTAIQAERFSEEDEFIDWKFDCLQTGDYYFFEEGGVFEGGDGPDRETKLDWVICGGESGPGARPMHPDWARSLRDQCASAGVPFFFKQWGAWLPTGQLMANGKLWKPLCGTSLLTTKAMGGHTLDGETHMALPN